MAINEQYRQLEVATALEGQARTLAHSTRDVPSPPESYDMLGELRSTLDLLEQVTRQLAAWHKRAIDGQHYAGEDETGDGGTATIVAAAALEQAAAAIAAASAAMNTAHSANGKVRWKSEPSE